ncbi:U2 small nuclear ribonucleoprotein auxiliary factor 35 kDa subunit-related protein 2 isoform X2 [Gopherus flavomarginatus]|uniref:U2 small nuclear ribonucleoprotein auxiliary factor 35 kDa subunit-related protein 2 isoform X2 n=1 Tax=Gopherus flavomarginatus TaxID=286002 RepID=UPI0021CBE999|nr:U2 small nuclear ribonucleoprotein auxiliary factor 35 kDa subunit-related protein 2 isoform X2 [Gopherus flavomarginatus]
MAASMLLPAAAPEKLGHKKYKAILKKEKRKKKRQALARLRDSEITEKSEPLSEEEELEEEEKQLEAERQKLHEEWLLREEKAQEDFRLKKEKEEAMRRLQEEEERKIKEEWEEQQRKEREEEEQKQQEKREREEAVQKMLDQAESQLENGATWHNPEPPENIGTEKDRANCPFYIKTGSCRFGDRCSRKHNYPTSSQTLLIRGMFVTFGMEQCRRDDYDTDASLEYSEEETYQQFLDFYEDVLPEFKNVGKVIQFKDCLKDRNAQEGNTATFCMYSEIHTMSFGRPIETYIFLLNGPISQLKTLKGETEQAITRTITASQEDGAAPAQIILTKEMENQRGKKVATRAKKDGGLAGQEVGNEGGHIVEGRRGEVVVAAEAVVVHVVVVEAEVEAPLGPGVGAKRGQIAEEEVMNPSQKSENSLRSCHLSNCSVTKDTMCAGDDYVPRIMLYCIRVYLVLK